VDQAKPPDDLRLRVSALAGREPAAWRPVAGGYTPAERWVVTYEDGSTAFVKAASAVNPDTARWLRDEYEIYRSLEATFLPKLLGWDDDGNVGPILLLEDLSAGNWGPGWSPDRVDRVLQTLEAIHRSPAPPAIRTLESDRAAFQGWPQVADDPEPFLRLVGASDAWAARALPVFAQAEAAAVFAGDDLLHLDVRSDNICFMGERTVFVDWNWACAGNGRLDVVSWLPSLALEGGPRPDEIVDDEPELGAVIAGFFASRAVQPEIPTAPRVRTIQKAQLAVALPWAARMLGLPPPG
jgi:hypothetical protein